MTREQIIAWGEEVTKRLTPELLSKVPLSEKQRKRLEQLREERQTYLRDKERKTDGGSGASGIGKAKTD